MNRFSFARVSMNSCRSYHAEYPRGRGLHFLERGSHERFFFKRVFTQKGTCQRKCRAKLWQNGIAPDETHNSRSVYGKHRENL